MKWKKAVGLRRIKNENIDIGLAILADDITPGFSDHPRIYSERSQLCPLAARGRESRGVKAVRIHIFLLEHKARHALMKTPRPVTRFSTSIGTKLYRKRDERLDWSDGWVWNNRHYTEESRFQKPVASHLMTTKRQSPLQWDPHLEVKLERNSSCSVITRPLNTGCGSRTRLVIVP